MFPQIFGKYVLERELAAGGMARVFLATLRGAGGFEKRLVVKQIRAELACDHAFVQRFVEEAKTAVELSHPNIVPVYELGVEQGVYYIAMEFCAGVTLADLLGETGKLSPEEGAYVGVEICRALDYAHRRSGIVHRDVTPRNVLIDEEGAVRLIDFGIAAPAHSHLAKSEVFGSPGHMPPEQLAGRPLTPATDVFAVAVLLVEAWSGRPPYRRASAKESELALHEPLPPLSSYDAGLERLSELLLLALSHDPAKRPAQAELFARPLRDFLRNVDAGDVARHLGERVRRSARRARRAEAWTFGPRTPSDSDSGLGTPSKSAGPLTRTFAVRNEVELWTHPVDAGSAKPSAEPVPDYSTRKLPSSVPPRQRLDPPSPAPDGQPREEPRARAPALRRNERGRRAVFAALAIAATGGALWLARPPHTGAVRAGALSSPATARTSEAPAGARTVDTVADAASANPRPPPSSPHAPPGSSTPSAPPKAPAPVVARTNGVLRLTADPPASVNVSGPGKSRSLVTPVRELRVPAGSYTVTFRSETYAAPVVARVVVESGLSRSVHADFREADPRVTVR